MVRTGLGHPKVDVAPALPGHDAEGRLDKGAADVGGPVAMVGVDHELERPGKGSLRDLGVPHRVIVARLPRHQPREPLSAPVHEVEPLMLAERPVVVGRGRHVEQLRDRIDVVLSHLAFDLEAGHRRRVPGGPSTGRTGPTGSLRPVPRPRSPKGRARETVARLAEEYPGSPHDLCALRHDGPFQLLVATILSAQCTDERVNLVTPALFARYPTPTDLAAADPDDVEALIRPTGFFRAKTRSLLGMARGVVERYSGEVPSPLEDLVTLPGVGRKTANVVRSVGFGAPGLPVDTHVGRLTRRLGLTTETDPVRIEHEVGALVPRRNGEPSASG